MPSEVVKRAKFKESFVPKPKLTSAYSAGLSRGLERFDKAQALKALSQEILKRVKSQIRQSAFSQAAKQRLARAVQVVMKPNSLQLVAKDPLWNYLVDGRHKRQMTWLAKSSSPIPIVTESGKVIFRSATAKTMKDGRWVHPGRRPLDLAERAKKEARVIIKKRLAKEVAAQLQRKIR